MVGPSVKCRTDEKLGTREKQRRSLLHKGQWTGLHQNNVQYWQYTCTHPRVAGGARLFDYKAVGLQVKHVARARAFARISSRYEW